MRIDFIYILCLIQLSSATLYEGDSCVLPFNEPGICIRLSKCPTAIEIVKNHQHPKTCSYVKSIPIVCCSLSTKPLHPSLSERKCQSYKMLTTPETTTTTATQNILKEKINKTTMVPFIIGGKDSKPREFPHMAALGFMDGDEKLWLCGGTLISEKFVLTAAHCLSSKEYGPVQWARLGSLSILAVITHTDYSIIRRIPHPSYKGPSLYHDIALVELSDSISFSSYIKPACLPSLELKVDPSWTLIATGWGLTNYGGSQSYFLQKVDLELFTEGECEEVYTDHVNTRKLRDGIRHDTMFCAGGRNEEKDTCQGDSGGPLQIKDGDTCMIIGVTSFGKSCGISNIPGVYTKVSTYVPWIENIIWPDEL